MSAYHIIGDQDTVLGYRFAGVSGTVANTPEQAREAFAEATRETKDGVLLITEAVEDIWGKRGKRRSLQDLIFEAVGIRIVEEK